MSSSVFFKFKSQKEPQRVTFDGTGISVYELKRDIISISRLGDGTDFDLAIYNVDTNEEYNDDTAIISRGTTVVARRLPAAKPGAGRAARYVSGKMPVTAKNQHRVEASRNSAVKPVSNSNVLPINNREMTEDEKIAAMFQAGDEVWEQQQQQLANQKAVPRTGGYQKPISVPDKPLPPGYTCHRCGEKGHWIQACPTNNDPTFDGRPKFRRTTGIPKAFLEEVEKPTALTSDGTVDVSQLPAGVMYTPTGQWVVARPDNASWEQFQAKTKASAEKAEAMATDNKELRERGLECPIDKRMFVDPMKTPCCGKTYCRDCIENTLLGNDFVCPGCSSDNVLVDNLVPDEEMVGKTKAYEEEKAQTKKEKKSPSPVPEKEAKSPSKQESTKSVSPKPSDAAASTAAAATAAAVTNGTPQPGTLSESKKRPADEQLENPRIPTGPAAMRNKQIPAPSNTPAPNNMEQFVQQMNAMAQGLPNGQAGMNAFVPPNMNMGFNPMMGMPPMNMNMMMGMNNPMMGMMMGGMPNSMMGGMNGMGGFPQNQRNNNNNNHNNNNMYGGAANGFNPMMMGNGGAGGAGAYGQWQGQGNQGWNNMGGGGAGMNGMGHQQHQGHQQGHQQVGMADDGAAAAGDDEAYFRKPVNPHRHQARNRRQRSVDYREM